MHRVSSHVACLTPAQATKKTSISERECITHFVTGLKVPSPIVKPSGGDKMIKTRCGNGYVCDKGLWLT